MGIALVVFLGVVPAGLVVLAARSPSSASLRRLSATVAVAGTASLDVARVGGRVRSRRLFGAVGAVVGLWATAAWESTTFSWDGLLASAARPSWAPGFGTGWLTFAGPSFVLAVNVFGILIGFAAGAVIAEWTGNDGAVAGRRAALLAPREARRYLAPWVGAAVAVGLGGSITALAAAALIPESLKSSTGDVGASPWWAVVLLGVGVVALMTRALVVSAAPQAIDADDLLAREITRALTAATTTTVALAAFMASAASTLARISTWFGWGWGDGIATAALAFSLLAVGLVVAAFFTPYWAIAMELDTRPAVAGS